MAGQVGTAGLKVFSRYSYSYSYRYSCPGIPMAAQVGTPMAAQVGTAGLKVVFQVFL